MQDSTPKKRIIFVIVYLILFSLAGYLLYKLIAPAPTCMDHKQNQDEKGIDCGGQCKPCKSNIQTEDLVVKEASFIDGGNGTFDAVAKISNPNYLTGASSFSYEIVLKDETGSAVGSVKGKNFILPADTKYVAEIGIRPLEGKIPKSVEFKISDIVWKELADLSNPQLEVNNKKFQKNATGIGSEVSGILKNSSTYDLESINIVVVLRDQYGKVLGINITKKDNVLAKEERSFLVTWSNNFSVEVSKIEVEAQSNIYNLIKS